MAGRTVYACTTCQPLLPETGPLPAARAAAVRAATQSVEFVSHCAAEVNQDQRALLHPHRQASMPPLDVLFSYPPNLHAHLHIRTTPPSPQPR